jgi:hypothetical protein
MCTWCSREIGHLLLWRNPPNRNQWPQALIVALGRKASDVARVQNLVDPGELVGLDGKLGERQARGMVQALPMLPLAVGRG